MAIWIRPAGERPMLVLLHAHAQLITTPATWCADLIRRAEPGTVWCVDRASAHASTRSAGLSIICSPKAIWSRICWAA